MFYKNHNSNYSNNFNNKRSHDSAYYKIKKYFLIPSLIACTIYFSKKCGNYTIIDPHSLYIKKIDEAIDTYEKNKKLLEEYKREAEKLLKEIER